MDIVKQEMLRWQLQCVKEAYLTETLDKLDVLIRQQRALLKGARKMELARNPKQPWHAGRMKQKAKDLSPLIVALRAVLRRAPRSLVEEIVARRNKANIGQ